MLVSTIIFLNQVHSYFDTLGYHPKGDVIDYDEFIESAVKTMNHTQSLDDAIAITEWIRFVSKKYNKIRSKIRRHYEYWQSIPCEANMELLLGSDEESEGVYFLTNGFSNDYREIYISGHCFGDSNLYGSKRLGNRFVLDQADYKYYLRFSKLSSSKMLLCNSYDKILCEIVLKDANIVLKHNRTDIGIIHYEGGIGVYKNSYLQSLDGADPDTNKLLAFIEWDALNQKTHLGLSRLELYENDTDKDLLLLLTMSPLLLFAHYIKHYRTMTNLMLLRTLR